MTHRILFADYRGKFEIEQFTSGDGEPSIMLSVTAPAPRTEPFALDSAEARLIAAALLDYADLQDAIADTTKIPKVNDDDTH